MKKSVELLEIILDYWYKRYFSHTDPHYFEYSYIHQRKNNNKTYIDIYGVKKTYPWFQFFEETFTDYKLGFIEVVMSKDGEVNHLNVSAYGTPANHTDILKELNKVFPVEYDIKFEFNEPVRWTFG